MFEKIQGQIGNGVTLFGAGSNGRWCCEYLQQNGHQVSCFVDNNPKMQGTTVDGIPVMSLKEYRHMSTGGVLLVTAKHAVRQILASLRDDDVAMSFDAWFYLCHAEAYAKAREMLYDEKSRETLDAVVRMMLTGDEDYVANVSVPNQYFCIPGFFHTLYDTFADIGTCTGDSVEHFLHAMTGTFRKAYAFEPGSQAEAAAIRFQRLRQEWGLRSDQIVLERMGIGAQDGWARVHDATYKESRSLDVQTEPSDGDIRIISLDSYFRDKELTFLKADIEGAEMDMLRGGHKVITSQQPKIAICVYHRPDDFLRILSLLHEYVPEYRFYLRHHSSLAVETVLYARK